MGAWDSNTEALIRSKMGMKLGRAPTDKELMKLRHKRRGVSPAVQEAYEAAEKAVRDQSVSQADLDGMLEQARSAGVRLRKVEEGEAGAAGSWLAGEPSLPAHIDWPWLVHPEEDQRLVPMFFVAQINLAEVQATLALPAFPSTGTLFFFADLLYAREWYWTNGCRVIYCAQDVSDAPLRQMPDVPSTPDWAKQSYNIWGLDVPTGVQMAGRQAICLEPHIRIDPFAFPQATFAEQARAHNAAEEQKLEARVWPDGKPQEGTRDKQHYFGVGFLNGAWRRDGTVPLLGLSCDLDIGLATPNDGKLSFEIETGHLADRDFERTVIFDGGDT